MVNKQQTVQSSYIYFVQEPTFRIMLNMIAQLFFKSGLFLTTVTASINSILFEKKRIPRSSRFEAVPINEVQNEKVVDQNG